MPIWGLMTIWNEEELEIINAETTTNWIGTTFKSKRNGVVFNVFNIYAPQTSRKKKEVWAILSNVLHSLKDTPTILIGDFNSVRVANVKINCVVRKKCMKTFNRWINDHNLIEVPLSNAKFTWIGPHQKMSRLDRVLVNGEMFDVEQVERMESIDEVEMILNSCNSDKAPVHDEINLQKAREGFHLDIHIEDEEGWSDLVKFVSVRIMFVPRKNLEGVDKLVKDSKARSNPLASWSLENWIQKESRHCIGENSKSLSIVKENSWLSKLTFKSVTEEEDVIAQVADEKDMHEMEEWLVQNVGYPRMGGQDV
ncbi:hypothetical protein POM88_013235 [Heracleum sosnowskyi]|uniref:Endonuclease/exonuclease/phosphatase domain-containing protein n=1 Tax=Heracleum sosnowskyi TaxID=360622 RepID=A0AAD8IY02_9APIA|nr:hypothetical protein POM88_013235 [Heracleum sosnowskyi]